MQNIKIKEKKESLRRLLLSSFCAWKIEISLSLTIAIFQSDYWYVRITYKESHTRIHEQAAHKSSWHAHKRFLPSTPGKRNNLETNGQWIARPSGGCMRIGSPTGGFSSPMREGYTEKRTRIHQSGTGHCEFGCHTRVKMTDGDRPEMR